MSTDDGYPGEMDDLNPDELVDGPLAGLADVFSEPDDRPAAEALAARAVALQASLSPGAANAAAGAGARSVPGRIQWRLKTMFGSLTALLATAGAKTATAAVAAVSLTGGLAAADALPDPIQEPVSSVASVVGIDLPTPGDDQQAVITDDASPTPKSSPTPEAGPTPDASPSPDSSPTPDASPSPDSSPTPDASPGSDDLTTPAEIADEIRDAREQASELESLAAAVQDLDPELAAELTRVAERLRSLATQMESADLAEGRVLYEVLEDVEDEGDALEELAEDLIDGKDFDDDDDDDSDDDNDDRSDSDDDDEDDDDRSGSNSGSDDDDDDDDSDDDSDDDDDDSDDDD